MVRTDSRSVNRNEYGDIITDTQRDSWNGTQKVMGEQDTRVLSLIKEAKDGLANFELCELTGRPAHGISGSLTRLKLREKIRDSRVRALNPNSSKAQIIWKATKE